MAALLSRRDAINPSNMKEEFVYPGCILAVMTRLIFVLLSYDLEMDIRGSYSPLKLSHRVETCTKGCPCMLAINCWRRLKV